MARWAHRRVLRIILSVATLALLLATYAAAIASPTNVAAAVRTTLSTAQGHDAATRTLSGALQSSGVSADASAAAAASALSSPALDAALTTAEHGGAISPVRDSLLTSLDPTGVGGSLPALDRAASAVDAGAPHPGGVSAQPSRTPARSAVLGWVAPRAAQLAALGATAATIGLAVALVAAPKRRSATMRSAGKWALLSCGVPLVLVLAAAPLTQALDAPAGLQLASMLARPLFSPMLATWGALALAGAGLFFGARFVGLLRVR